MADTQQRQHSLHASHLYLFLDSDAALRSPEKQLSDFLCTGKTTLLRLTVTPPATAGQNTAAHNAVLVGIHSASNPRKQGMAQNQKQAIEASQSYNVLGSI